MHYLFSNSTRQSYEGLEFNILHHRSRKLYMSARIYKWKLGKGEWKLPFASPTGRVDFFGFVIIFEEKKELTSIFYSLQKQHKHSEERLFGRFKMSIKCDQMFTLVCSKCNPMMIFQLL